MRLWRHLGGPLAGLCLGLGIGWLVWGGGASGPARWAGSLGGADSVLVIVVETQGNLDVVRRAISADRIVARSETGLAVAPQRLIVSSLETAGELLTRAGWQDRPLEIVGIARGSRKRGAPDERLARVASLMNKPSLTRAEAHLLLNSM